MSCTTMSMFAWTHEAPFRLLPPCMRKGIAQAARLVAVTKSGW